MYAFYFHLYGLCHEDAKLRAGHPPIVRREDETRFGNQGS